MNCWEDRETGHIVSFKWEALIQKFQFPIFNSVYYLCDSLNVQGSMGARGTGDPGAGVTGCCDLPVVVAKN